MTGPVLVAAVDAGFATLLSAPVGVAQTSHMPHLRSPRVPRRLEDELRVEVGAESADAFTADVGLATAGVEVLAMPEVAFVLIACGYLAVAAWLALPHLWVLGISAAPLLGAGATGLMQISPAPGAILLLVLAAASLAMEVFSLPGFMLHAAGGALALAGAGLWLHGPWSGAHPGVACPAALVVGLGTWVAARRSGRAALTDPLSDSPRLVGRELVILDAQDGLGHAVVAGQLWTVRDPERPLRPGGVARVTGCRGDELIVRQRGFLFSLGDS
jgi:membrane-bound serine protease (ClpP class)